MSGAQVIDVTFGASFNAKTFYFSHVTHAFLLGNPATKVKVRVAPLSSAPNGGLRFRRASSSLSYVGSPTPTLYLRNVM